MDECELSHTHTDYIHRQITRINLNGADQRSDLNFKQWLHMVESNMFGKLLCMRNFSTSKWMNYMKSIFKICSFMFWHIWASNVSNLSTYVSNIHTHFNNSTNIDTLNESEARKWNVPNHIPSHAIEVYSNIFHKQVSLFFVCASCTLLERSSRRTETSTLKYTQWCLSVVWTYVYSMCSEHFFLWSSLKMKMKKADEEKKTRFVHRVDQKWNDLKRFSNNLLVFVVRLQMLWFSC